MEETETERKSSRMGTIEGGTKENEGRRSPEPGKSRYERAAGAGLLTLRRLLWVYLTKLSETGSSTSRARFEPSKVVEFELFSSISRGHLNHFAGWIPNVSRFHE